MINYQDRSKAVTAEDIIRRYKLDSLESNTKAISTLRDGLTKTNNELEQYVEVIENIKNQGGSSTTWFLNGLPTLLNEPYTKWKEEDRDKHIGDLYYDKDTGKVYAFIYDEGYKWLEILDSEIINTLSVASSAKDAKQDSSRQTFFETPTPPYFVGDVWYNDGTILRCRSARSEGEFNQVDWVDSLLYTDDINSLTTQAVLNQFKEEVENNYVTNSRLETNNNSITAEVNSTLTNYVTNDKYNELNRQVKTIQTDTYTKTEINTKLTDGSVTKVSTISGTFDEDGMTYEKSGSITKSTINQVGLTVKNTSNNQEMLFAGYDENENKSVVRTENLEVRTYLIIGDKGRFEKTQKGVGFYTL